jgi:hypothetical protein
MKRRERGGNCHRAFAGARRGPKVATLAGDPIMRAMTSGGKDRKTAKPSPRSQRLAVELRENLRKRKAQERGRTTSAGEEKQTKANVRVRDEH